MGVILYTRDLAAAVYRKDTYDFAKSCTLWVVNNGTFRSNEGRVVINGL